MRNVKKQAAAGRALIGDTNRDMTFGEMRQLFEILGDYTIDEAMDAFMAAFYFGAEAGRREELKRQSLGRS